MLMGRKHRENNNIQEEHSQPSSHFFSNLLTNIRYNLKLIKEINACKTKEEIMREEEEMKKILIRNKSEYFRKRRELFTETNLNLYKSQLIHIFIYFLYMVLFITIVAMQLKITEGYYSHTILSHITSK